MKNYIQKNSFLLILVLAGLFLNSCDKNNDPVTQNYEFLFSNDHKFDITTTQAKANLLTFQSVIPESSLLGAIVQHDVEVHKLTYKTRFQDKNIQASGLVCLPKTAGNYPVLCFQNGTNTEHSKAPTEDPKNELFSIMESVASMGFIVVMPDYIGFGASSQFTHPYLIAKPTNQSILDLLRAVNEFGTGEQIEAKPTKDLYIFGYSQGGWATMQLQKTIETNYAAEFNLVASSCAAGPYSLSYINDYVTGEDNYPMPYFLAYLLNSYTALGEISNPLSDFIQTPYAAKIPGLFDGKHTGGTINSELTPKMSNLITTEYRTEYATNPKFTGIKAAFLANSIAAWNISTPTRLYHGANDEFIPVGMSNKMYADFKTAGVPDSKLQLVIIPGVDHPTGVVPVGISTVLWFLEIKAGL